MEVVCIAINYFAIFILFMTSITHKRLIPTISLFAKPFVKSLGYFLHSFFIDFWGWGLCLFRWRTIFYYG